MRRRTVGVLRGEGVVVLLDVDPEPIAGIRQDVVRGHDRERAPLAQKLGGLLVANVGIDPVKRREGDDRVERAAARLPGLELRSHDLDGGKRRQLPAGDLGERRAQLDSDDLEPSLGERQRRLPRPGPDLEHASAVPEGPERDEVVEDLARIAGSRPVVELRDVLERRPQAVAAHPLVHDEMMLAGRTP
jgi:hypothetical protein